MNLCVSLVLALQALSEVTSTLTQQQQQAAADDSSSKSADSKAAQHVFSALIYLRKLCSHPLLALDWTVPAHREACQLVLGSAAAASQAAAESALRAIEHAPKLLALQDILVQCGLVSADAALGSSNAGGRGGAAAAAAQDVDELTDGSSDSGHRLLVFAQLKGMLDLVESCLLRPLGVSSLRLDGSVDAGSRFGVVQRFNSDPTIQVRCSRCTGCSACSRSSGSGKATSALVAAGSVGAATRPVFMAVFVLLCVACVACVHESSHICLSSSLTLRASLTVAAAMYALAGAAADDACGWPGPQPDICRHCGVPGA
jgi:hypothetical protein